MTTIDDLAARQSPTPDPMAAAEQLAALLDLPSVGVKIHGAKIVGKGARASAQVQLSNGEELEFDSLRDMIRPQNLVAEVAACTGATPSLDQKKAARAVALTRALAERIAGMGDDAAATSWGLEYLQAATTIDVDMNDQGSRWATFKHLDTINPFARANEYETGLAAASVVLRHTDGSRLVRTGWFREYVKREQDHSVSGQHIHNRMQRAGWKIRGNEGRIKATSPANGQRGARGEHLTWTFYDVPADWEKGK